MIEVTHEIISMKRAETSGSKSPMWRCTCANGDRVNVFQHADAAKDNMRLFSDYPEMKAMAVDEEITWKGSPIGVTLAKDGQWWKIMAVAPRPEGAQPDPSFIPDPALYRERAIRTAAILIQQPTLVFLDTEATGIDANAQMISIAVLNCEGEVIINTLVKPTEIPTASALEVHHITPEMLAAAPTVAEVYPLLMEALDGKLWVAYNTPFDVRMVEQACARAGLRPPGYIGTNDVMQIMAQFRGEWNPKYQSWTPMKLADAIEMLGPVRSVAYHDALEDVLVTRDVLAAVANASPDKFPF